MGNETPGTGGIIAALAKARAAFKPVHKDSLNPHFRNRYASLDAILEAVTPALCAQGLVVTHELKPVPDAVHMVTSLRHVGGEVLSSEIILLPTKPDAQGYGSAMTYARRYSIQALLSIAADEDDDAEQASKPAPAKSPAPEPEDRRTWSEKYADLRDKAEKAGQGANFKLWTETYLANLNATLDDLTEEQVHGLCDYIMHRRAEQKAGKK